MVKLIERVVDRAADDGSQVAKAEREAIECLVDAVQCRARTLNLLALNLRDQG